MTQNRKALHSQRPSNVEDDTERHRLDKWLWAARFYKTRTLAAHEAELGRVLVNGQSAKPSKEVRVGDVLHIRASGAGGYARECVVQGLNHQRRPAAEAQLLYAETPASIAARETAQHNRRMNVEPSLALSFSHKEGRQGRPTKRDRRELDTVKNRHSASTSNPNPSSPATWEDRWSFGI